MPNKEYKHSELTGKIIGCCMEVHKILGNGFQEVIYQRALEKEMKMRGIGFSREHEMPVFYKNEHRTGAGTGETQNSKKIIKIQMTAPGEIRT